VAIVGTRNAGSVDRALAVVDIDLSEDALAREHVVGHARRGRPGPETV
jgi:hypothetical protein